MLDLNARWTCADWSPVDLGQRAVFVSAFVGEVFRLRRNLVEPLSLLLAPVGAVTVEPSFFAMAAGLALRGCHARWRRSRWRSGSDHPDCPLKYAVSCRWTTATRRPWRTGLRQGHALLADDEN